MLENEEHIAEPNRKIKQNKKKAPPAQQVFLGNVIALSEKTEEYVMKHRKKYKAIVLLETHQTNSTSWLQQTRYEFHHNLDIPTSKKGSHGAELVACRDHLNCTLIKQKVWDTIKEVSLVPIRIAAVILKINTIEFILAGIYLTEGEECSKNKIMLYSRVMLQNILNLPKLFFGDFNIHITDMIDSGLLKAHNLNIIELPGGTSTKYGKRQITYIIHSGNLNSMIHNVQKVTEVPFGPHFGYTF